MSTPAASPLPTCYSPLLDWSPTFEFQDTQYTPLSQLEEIFHLPSPLPSPSADYLPPTINSITPPVLPSPDPFPPTPLNKINNNHDQDDLEEILAENSQPTQKPRRKVIPPSKKITKKPPPPKPKLIPIKPKIRVEKHSNSPSAFTLRKPIGGIDVTRITPQEPTSNPIERTFKVADFHSFFASKFYI